MSARSRKEIIEFALVGNAQTRALRGAVASSNARHPGWRVFRAPD
jgi:hypothetical protein